MTDVVTNSSCLIGLERIQQLQLLPQVFMSIVIPEAVQQEIGFRAAFLKVQPVQNQNLVTILKTQVDDGEAEAIALAQEISASYLILDDGKARKLANQLNLKVIGTVGVLLRAKQQQIIPAVRPLLDALLLANFRISEALVQKALQLAGEVESDQS
uniref:DUF3368 domain-containing protein n=1 Tax=Oscillatoriales cyanobacterium SpSt-402 TaxID=2282168 RepID=A0A832H0M3_9CYAN